MPRRLSLFLIFSLVLVSCVDDTSADTTVAPGATTTIETSTTGVAPASTTTTRPDLSGLDGLAIGVRQQLEDLMVAAQEIRGLAFLSTPKVTVVDDQELERRVEALIVEESEDFPADEALYKLLGLLDPATNLQGLLLDLYGEQVAGFYDGDTGEIVVPARDDGLSLVQQGTMIHELVHALTDQHFGFSQQFDLMFDEDRLDEATAFQALTEGDATLAEIQWVRSLSQRDLGRFVAESLEVDMTVFRSVPQFLQDALIFPYQDGLAFVQDLFNRGGWDAVNDAYSTMPGLPGSSEQIITPDDYRRDLPEHPAAAQVDLAGYNLERTSVWGEHGFRIMLDQVVGESASSRAADGWGGDYYKQWFDGVNAALLIVYQGDTTADLEELRLALLDYARTAVAEEDFVWVDEEGGLLYFIAADEVSVGEQLRSTFGLG